MQMPTESCYIQLMGGLGNQLFQVAAAYAHCKRTGKTLKIAERIGAGPRKTTYWNTYFNALKDNMSGTKSGMHFSTLWREPRFGFVPIPAEANALFGYFQSSQYFKEFKNEIRSLFHPGSAVHIKMLKTHGSLLVAKPMATAVHIRRGDYVSLPTVHCILTPDWYRRALADREAKALVVFSDDIAWCRGLDFLQGATFVEEPDEVVALHLMSQFRRFVLSNSSFSWWAAFLAGSAPEDVVVPDRWFGPAGPQDYEDIYEPMWKRLPVDK